MGLAIARMLGHLTYLSRDGMTAKFDPVRDKPREIASDFEMLYGVGSYLAHQGDKFVERFDANSYITLTRAMDRFDLSAHGGSPAGALKRAAAERALVIGVESDILFTINEQNAIADAFTAAGTETEFVPLASLEGHDAFLVDIEPFSAAIGRFLATN